MSTMYGHAAFERLEAKNKQLLEALEPFAAYAEQIDSHYSSQGYPDTCPATLNPNIDGTKEIVHLGDFRRAREAIKTISAERRGEG